MASVSLSAGQLSVNITDEGADAEELTALSEAQMRFLMQEWTSIDGEMVSVQHPGFSIGR